MNLMVLKLFDLNGKIILSEDMTINNGEKNSIDVSKLSEGVYILEISNSLSINSKVYFINISP